MRPEDSDYYRARAIEERWLVRDAQHAQAAEIHSKLASRYEVLADSLELQTRLTEDILNSACKSIPSGR